MVCDALKVAGLNPNWGLLGLMRFILAFIVLSEHLGWFLDIDPVLKITKFSALVAVLSFLVISGFSIAASYESKTVGFYKRRALRIVPVYLIGIGFSLLVFHYLAGMQLVENDLIVFPEITIILGNVFFMQGLVVGSLESNPIVWTLMIEVFFYVITPILNSKSKFFIPTIIVSALVFCSQRYTGFQYYSQMLYGLNIVYLGWAWLIGFWLYHHRRNIGAAFFALSLGIVAIAINGYFTPVFWSVTWVLTCAVVGYGHLIRLPFSFVAKLLGNISYPLYLLHIPLLYCLSISGLPKNGVVYCFVVVVISLLVDLLIDRPFKIFCGFISNKNHY